MSKSIYTYNYDINLNKALISLQVAHIKFKNKYPNIRPHFHIRIYPYIDNYNEKIKGFKEKNDELRDYFSNKHDEYMEEKRKIDMENKNKDPIVQLINSKEVSNVISEKIASSGVHIYENKTKNRNKRNKKNNNNDIERDDLMTDEMKEITVKTYIDPINGCTCSADVVNEKLDVMNYLEVDKTYTSFFNSKILLVNINEVDKLMVELKNEIDKIDFKPDSNNKIEIDNKLSEIKEFTEELKVNLTNIITINEDKSISDDIERPMLDEDGKIMSTEEILMLRDNLARNFDDNGDEINEFIDDFD
jgi:hypothetical protein